MAGGSSRWRPARGVRGRSSRRATGRSGAWRAGRSSLRSVVVAVPVAAVCGLGSCLSGGRVRRAGGSSRRGCRSNGSARIGVDVGRRGRAGPDGPGGV